MKKLSLLFFATFVSVAGWAASLNPYAYNLSSTWNEATSELTVRFKLNAHPNMKENSSGRGIQIFAIDPSDNNKQYYIYGVPGDIIKAKMNEYNGGKGDSYDYELTIPITGVTWNGKEVLPAGKTLTWAVNVAGLNKTDQSAPVVVNTGVSDDYRPFSCHGIAINKDQNSKDFGSIYVTEASEGTNNTPWNWIKTQNKGRSLLKYTPKLDQVEAYHKFAADGVTSQNFSLRNGYDLLEPHRVRISDDGRIFVSSYNKNSSAVTVVWEFDKNTRQFIPIINHNTDYGHRVCAMDVKGSGNNLKILLCYFSEDKKYNSTFKYAFAAYEYSITSSNTYPISTGAKRILYQPGMGSSLTDYTYGQGVLYWTQGKQGNTDSNPNTANGYFYSDGFANVAYGKTNNTDIFFAFDYFYSSTFNTRTMYYKNCTPNNAFFSGTVDYHTMNESNHYLGGAGFLTYKDGSNEYLVAGHAKNYLIKDNAEGDGRVQVYPFDRSKSDDNISYTAEWTVNTKTKACINDMAMDHANNIYAISFSDGTSTTPGTGRIVAIAMPYGGSTLTIAPSSNAEANRLFTLKPVPNILATDLRFAPVPKQPKYRFSFNVNTKPAAAQIRFYKSYGDNSENDMKKNLAKINADDYQGGNEITPSFVYNIPDKFLKQGEIAVEFDMVGGKVENGELKNTALPRGEWYWSVYVEAPRKSAVFAPIYKQGSTGEDTHYRLHATVNNYPETDGFGHIYAAQYNNTLNPVKKSLMVYNFNPTGYCNDEQGGISNSTRYKLVNEFVNPSGEKTKFENQRRLTVAPNGLVYIADHGQTNQTQYQNKNWADRPMVFKNGGIYVWNPKSQEGNEIQLQQFLNNATETSSGVAIWNHGGKLKLYGMNTYGEFGFHTGGENPNNALKWKNQEYSPDNQNDIDIYGWNGFKEYNLGTLENILQGEDKEKTTIQRSLLKGDAGGNTSIVAMEKGIWICQHRENDVQYTIDQFLKDRTKTQALPDNTENYLLSFVPYNSSTRAWTSCTTKGINYSDRDAQNRYQNYDFNEASDLTQKTSSHVQSAPGAGMTYRKINGVDYIFMVKHTGDIAQLEVTWSGNTPTVTYVRDYPSIGTKTVVPGTNRPTGTITSMCFDYAGNLVTTAGKTYFDDGQDIIVYTMPYDRKNAREIQAPNSCRFIPERTAYLEPRSEMNLTLKQYIEGEGTPKPCYLDIFRPMPNTSFSTICLPFDLDMKQLTTEALKDAEVKQYTGLQLSDIGGEKMLELVFEDVPIDGEGKQVLIANTPYIIQPKVRIPGIIKLQEPIQFVTISEKSIENATQNNEYAITFKGLIPTDEQIEVKYANGQPLTLLLVAENRLAEMVPDAGTTGRIFGFRGYFELNKPLNGIGARITPKQSVFTSTTIIVDGKRVNIKKYLREGRVYIRMGDTLYTIDGQKVQ